jgi:hypothetical protein
MRPLRIAGTAMLLAALGVCGCGGGTPINIYGTVSIPFDGSTTYSAGTVTVQRGQTYSYTWGTNDCDGVTSQPCALELQNDDGQEVVLAAPTYSGSVYLQAGTWTGVPGLGAGSQFTPDQMWVSRNSA